MPFTIGIAKPVRSFAARAFDDLPVFQGVRYSGFTVLTLFGVRFL
jgi:hypothetical protein